MKNVLNLFLPRAESISAASLSAADPMDCGYSTLRCSSARLCTTGSLIAARKRSQQVNTSGTHQVKVRRLGVCDLEPEPWRRCWFVVCPPDERNSKSAESHRRNRRTTACQCRLLAASSLRDEEDEKRRLRTKAV